MGTTAVGEAATCRTYLQESREAIGGHVVELVQIEKRAREADAPAADLMRRARAIASAVYPDKAAAEEEALARCRNFVPQVRRTCRDAAVLLARVVEQPKDAEDERNHYMKLISQCETWLRLPHPPGLPRVN
jgi:hypothetical protein